MMSYLHTKLHDNWISSFRGVAMTRFWDGQTDGVTALLDLLSPSATQVKTKLQKLENCNGPREWLSLPVLVASSYMNVTLHKVLCHLFTI